MNKVNFSAGPAILPKEVIISSSEAVLNFKNSGLSILEISHRSKDFIETMERSKILVKELYQINEEYEVIFLTGGASSQFYMAPMNLLDDDETAGYLLTGTWAKNAIKEAKRFGKIEILGSSEETNFDRIPKGFEIKRELKYVHLTSNNTIFGTQIHKWPETEIKFVCDMSSDIFSRPIEINKYDLIYAGAQKNMGPAGVTLVIVRKEALNKVKRTMPTMLSYDTHIKNESMYNTPPVFPIYVSMLTMEWIKSNGGVKGMEDRNEAKAKLIYDQIDKSTLFEGHSMVEDRSLMNVTFRLKDEKLDLEFNKICEEAGLEGLKGHRSVGGYRASIYNAMEIDGVKRLVTVMEEFENKKG